MVKAYLYCTSISSLGDYKKQAGPGRDIVGVRWAFFLGMHAGMGPSSAARFDKHGTQGTRVEPQLFRHATVTSSLHCFTEPR